MTLMSHDFFQVKYILEMASGGHLGHIFSTEPRQKKIVTVPSANLGQIRIGIRLLAF